MSFLPCATLLTVCSPLCAPTCSFHHSTNPMHTLSTLSPNRNAHHIYLSLTTSIHSMSQPSTLFPLAQGLSSAPHPPQAPSRACWRCNVYGVSGTRPKSARMAHPTRHTDAHPLSLGPPGAYHFHTGLSNDALSGSDATVGRSPRRSDSPLRPPSPHLCIAMLTLSRGCRG